MKMSHNNISSDTIDFYMQKSHQVRSDAIFNGLMSIKNSIIRLLKILRAQRSSKINNAAISNEGGCLTN